MIAKTTLPSPIHLLDHIIIPINIRKSHWFRVHINLQTRGISLLDSSQVYSAASYPVPGLRAKFPKMNFPEIKSTDDLNWIGAILYVDDLVLIATSAQELQDMIDACQA